MRIHGKEAILQRMDFELRYRQGYTYLDRCGTILNEVERTNPEWFVRQPGVKGTGLVSIVNGCEFNFSDKKLGFGVEQAVDGEPLDTGNFAVQIEELTSLVIERLNLTEFSRIGFRPQYLFPFKEKEMAEKWLLDLGCYSYKARLQEAFKGEIEATGFNIVIAGEEMNFRIAFHGIERNISLPFGDSVLHVSSRSLPEGQRKHLLKQEKVKRLLKKNPTWAAMIDVDAYQDEPDLKPTSAKDFVLKCAEDIPKMLNKATA